MTAPAAVVGSRTGGTPAAVCLRVDGTVQGVGFRPFVFRLACELGLAGHVRNDARGVIIDVEGPPDALDAFAARLVSDAPPLAAVTAVAAEPRAATACRGFEIRRSDAAGRPDAVVAADSATCADCLHELFDPRDRRFRYPFINCTNCGPRFSIVRGVPYDRARTTMAGFVMCPACRTEYEDPGHRRFHAQPNACPRCGPRVALWGASGRGPGEDAVAVAARALRAGAIVAVKGLGGYHLACRADDEEAVARLRARKHREDRPFALMVGDWPAAERLIVMEETERELLSSPSRPIVLAPRHAGAAVAPSVAPGCRELGVMLAYTPLHHLLLADAGLPLVMTSGNRSDEPIAYRDNDARRRLLGAVADLVLAHDRPIETRTDDSVVRVVAVGGGRRPLMLRRSRGYVPGSLPLAGAGGHPPVLACGAELKNTFCLARDGRAWVSHHIGDLSNYDTLVSFREGIEHVAALFDVAPEVAVHDLHPGYLSTQYALEREDLRPIGVQHHHAHLAACLAEHSETGPAVGAIFDGTGDGGDGSVWGGEILVGGLRGVRRAGALRQVRLPGGEAAIRQPWRMACAWLGEVGEPAIPRALQGRVEPGAWRRVGALARGGPNSPLTSSMGRLFDAVAALAGIRIEVTYEGQAAVELEAACERGARPYPFGVLSGEDGSVVLDPEPTLRAVLGDVAAGVSVGTIAARFHAAVASATTRALVEVAAAAGVDVVVLAGGVFANRVLLERTARECARAGLRVLVPRLLPPGDGAIAYGQAAVAAASEAAA